MKKFLCLLLCLTLFASAALAAEVSPTKKFRNQFITGGNGIKGTVSLTASGMADWLEYLLPFTASEMQVRIIGEAHGKYTETNPDDDDWQVQLYAEDAQGTPHANTYVYGDPNAIYISSELLPDAVLMLPAEDAHIPYGIVDGELASLFLALDPLGLLTAEQDGNTPVYSALANLSQINEEEWADQWVPVLEKYYTDMDMWLAAYGAAPVIGGSTGTMTMKSSYTIPGDDVKAKAKEIIGMMVYDYDLQALLDEHFSLAQKTMYLNPALVYFYEACIDALPLNGNIVLEREMTAMGETIGMSFSLPLPQMPDELTRPAGEFLANCFSLPYTDVLADIDRISFSQSGGDISISVSSPQRTISFIIDETVTSAEAANLEGFVRINPAVGSNEAPLSASFSYKTSHVMWSDENEALHDDTTYALSIAPDLSLLDDDDPFRGIYVDFAPISIELSLNYYTKTERIESATRLQIAGKAQLPDAEIGVEADLRTASKWDMADLPTAGAENLLTMSDVRKNELLKALVENAVSAMIGMSKPAPEADETTVTDMSAPAPTEVPPMV